MLRTNGKKEIIQNKQISSRKKFYSLELRKGLFILFLNKIVEHLTDSFFSADVFTERVFKKWVEAFRALYRENVRVVLHIFSCHTINSGQFVLFLQLAIFH